MIRLCSNIPALIILLLALALPGMTTAQEAATTVTEAAGQVAAPTAPTAPTTTATVAQVTDSITSLTQQIEALKAEDPDSEAAVTAEELLQNARDELKLREQYTSATREHSSVVSAMPAVLKQMEEIRTELNDQGTTTSVLPTTATAEQVEQTLGELRAQLESRREGLTRIDAENEKRISRVEAIPRELVEAQQGLRQSQLVLDSAPADEQPVVAGARRARAQARVLSMSARIESLRAEQQRFNETEKILPEARELMSQAIPVLERRIRNLSDRHAEQRITQAGASARQLTQRDSMASHPLVRAVSRENTSITAHLDLAKVVRNQDEAVARAEELNEQAELITARYDEIVTRFDTAEYSDALGMLLRKQASDLPSLRQHRQSIEARSRLLSEVNLRTLEVQEFLREVRSPDEAAQRMLDAEGVDTETTEGLTVKRQIVELLNARTRYLTEMRTEYDKYFHTLVELNAAENQLVQQTADFSAFISERILWLPSAERVSLATATGTVARFADLMHPDIWKSYANNYILRAREMPFLFGAGVVFVLGLLAFHQRWKKRLRELLDTASRNRLESFRPLLKSFMYAALYVLPLPLLIFAASWPLTNLFRVPLQISSMANGLLEGSLTLFYLRFLQVVIQNRGIAQVFFAWPEQPLIRLRRSLVAFMWIYIPSVILISMWMFDPRSASPNFEAVRVLLVLVLGVAAVFVALLFRPSDSIMRDTNIYGRGTLLFRLRYPIFFAVLLGFAALILATLSGYIHSVVAITSRLETSLWLGGLVLLVSEAAFFWILVNRRRLAIEEARKRREAARAQEEAEGSSTEVNALVEPTLDIAAISEQAGKLFRILVLTVFVIFLWGVWADVLPALRFLDNHSLWNTTREVATTASDGTVQNVNTIVPVTVADLLLVVLIIIAVVVALRNIPGLLDITVYQKFAVQMGERYAFNTLIRYVFIIFSVIGICYLLGLQWNHIQWLVAGVSVGLGFGLQEIFANFVSGVILLFERPVRVGDTVTIGSMTGRVSQIRIRATTVVDWEHRENVIPNKELITEPVVNWTLSDRKTRLSIPISVPFGSDYAKVREIILGIARDCPHVLLDPAPLVSMERFSAAGAEFLLLVHLPNSDNNIDVRFYLLTEIERQLNAVGIEVPFIPYEVHVPLKNP